MLFYLNFILSSLNREQHIMIYCLQKIRYPALQICFIFYFLFIDMFVSDIFTEDVERIQGIQLYHVTLSILTLSIFGKLLM